MTKTFKLGGELFQFIEVGGNKGTVKKEGDSYNVDSIIELKKGETITKENCVEVFKTYYDDFLDYFEDKDIWKYHKIWFEQIGNYLITYVDGYGSLFSINEIEKIMDK